MAILKNIKLALGYYECPRCRRATRTLIWGNDEGNGICPKCDFIDENNER